MSRKFLITVILILFLLPLVSWYYLQSGLEWRRKAQEGMSGTTPFPEGPCFTADGRLFTIDSLGTSVSIVSFQPCGQDDAGQMDVLQVIYDQFKGTDKAKFILLDTCPNQETPSTTSIRKHWYELVCTDSTTLCNTLISDWPADKLFALVDRKGIIRSYYSIETPEEKRILVEHMSLLLPRDRQEKVELKRGEKK